MRLTRVRGGPFEGEALGVGDLDGGHLARSAVTILDPRFPPVTGQS